jgi:hypothetical protein
MGDRSPARRFAGSAHRALAPARELRTSPHGGPHTWCPDDSNFMITIAAGSSATCVASAINGANTVKGEYSHSAAALSALLCRRGTALARRGGPELVAEVRPGRLDQARPIPQPGSLGQGPGLGGVRTG